ncbi:GNAT family N-acetyltransferase [Micromonospora sp. NPDC000663]|uniref:GNAT family N-acetyltransferase n=1 Tax=Micromonospora sp. NPDC000663 TaxID=3364218 RepID=UPI0036C8269B
MAADKGAIDVGAALRDLRRRADLSQRELAEQAGVPKSTVARIEAGQGARPAFRTVELLVRAAGGELAVTMPGDPSCEAVSEPEHTREDEPRDEAGRRYPAHLDVRRVLTLKDWPGAWWVHSYTLSQRLWPVRVPELTYDLGRARRDERRLRNRTRAQVRFRRATEGLPTTSWRFLAEVPGVGPVGELRAHERSFDLRLGEDWGDRRELVLEGVLVAPGLRTLGIGRQLIGLLAREMAEAGIRTTHAMAEAGNVEFLLACGFELQPSRPSALTLEVGPVSAAPGPPGSGR